MIRKKKWRSDYALARSSKHNAHVLETQLPIGHAVNYPFFEGFFTLKNSRKASDSLDDSAFISPLAKVNGFLESTGATKLDLTGKKKKIIKTLSGSVFHFFADDICDILFALKVYPKAELILDMANLGGVINNPSYSFIGFFFDALEDQGIDFKLIDSTKFDLIYINDYCVAESAYRSSMSGDLIFEFFKKYIDEPKTKPYRNVYLTRKKISKDILKIKETASKLSHQTDERIDSEDGLAEVFERLGFEVVAPEDFKDFHEQLNFFYSVKTIASLTSSGLANALFMQPGGTVIEISTPLVVLSPILSGDASITDIMLESNVDPTVAQELHMFYKLVAFLKKHTYLSINNPDRSFEQIEKLIRSDEKLLGFIDNNEKSNNL